MISLNLQSEKINIIITPILQISKLEFMKVKEFAQITVRRKISSWILAA